MNPQKLHILMPTYNRAYLLERTLSRLFAQDADVASWHVTVVDNASTDDTRQILECYGRLWKNFDFVVNERNLGLFGNLNRCMSLARTQKYLIVHSDDDVDTTLVSSVLEFIGRHPDVQMCFGSCRARFEETGEIIPYWYRSRLLGDAERILEPKELISILIRSSSNFIFAPTVVYDRDFFTPKLRYSEEFKYTADLDLWFRVALENPKVGFMPRPQITCGIHAGRLSHKHADAMRLEALVIFRRYLGVIQGKPDGDIITRRLAWFIRLKLRLYEIAIRFHLVPGFKLRRLIAAGLEALSPRVQARNVAR